MAKQALQLPGVRASNPKSAPVANPRGRRRRGRGRGRARGSRRGRRRNPSDSGAALRAGLGGGIGSLVGSLVMGGIGFAMLADQVVDETDGAMLIDQPPLSTKLVFAAPGMVWLGSAVGGALGAMIGAPDDRNRRAAIGGGVGGLLGPIGAGIGGAIGGSKRDKPSDNPSTLGVVAAAGVGLAAAGAGYMAYRSWKAMNQPKLPPGPALAEVLADGATLADSPFVVGDVLQPVQLTTVVDQGVGSYSYVPALAVLLESADGYAPVDVVNASFGQNVGGINDDTALSGRLVGGATFDQTNTLPGGVSDKAIARVVTGVKGAFARDLYERALSRIANSDLDYDDPTQRDKAIREILGKVVPTVDYSRGLETYTFNDAPSRVWRAAQLMMAIAYQTFLNRAAQA